MSGMSGSIYLSKTFLSRLSSYHWNVPSRIAKILLTIFKKIYSQIIYWNLVLQCFCWSCPFEYLDSTLLTRLPQIFHFTSQLAIPNFVLTFLRSFVFRRNAQRIVVNVFACRQMRRQIKHCECAFDSDSHL